MDALRVRAIYDMRYSRQIKKGHLKKNPSKRKKIQNQTSTPPTEMVHHLFCSSGDFQAQRLEFRNVRGREYIQSGRFSTHKV